MAELSSIFRRTSSVRFRNVGGEGVIVHQDAGEVMVVNGTGALVFEFADGKHTLEEILSTVAERYPEQNREQVTADVVAFADQLLEAGALERAGED